MQDITRELQAGKDAQEKLEFLLRELEYTGTDFALPPAQLRMLVSGTDDLVCFLFLGRAGAECIIQLLSEGGADLAGINDILDFGCGCGRVLRYLARMLDKPVDGTDCNETLVAWLSNNLPRGRVYLNELSPPTEHAENSFDLVYALSVFTHLTAEQQLAWMSEFARIVRPGGHLILTTHGKHGDYVGLLSDDEVNKFLAGELVVRAPEREGTNDCFAMQSYEQVAGTLCRWFEIVTFKEHGARGNPHQDIYLLKKRT